MASLSRFPRTSSFNYQLLGCHLKRSLLVVSSEVRLRYDSPIVIKKSDELLLTKHRCTETSSTVLPLRESFGSPNSPSSPTRVSSRALGLMARSLWSAAKSFGSTTQMPSTRQATLRSQLLQPTTLILASLVGLRREYRLLGN